MRNRLPGVTARPLRDGRDFVHYLIDMVRFAEGRGYVRSSLLVLISYRALEELRYNNYDQWIYDGKHICGMDFHQVETRRRDDIHLDIVVKLGCANFQDCPFIPDKKPERISYRFDD
ncbi:hypothetical protein [Rhizobium phage RHph_X2_28B]|uniref:hypothetical protein n=1 Tax=Rhizobium phage RHph_X2_28B TaxID=2836086 RepID=UPI0023295874|nr:hypothetical protein PP751_gp098 [Rhizobium phage RHph_X2_28B]QWY83549.1 hypothetical protein [Rhizobium phage RHph_X2_28B]